MKKNLWLFPLTLFIFTSVIAGGLWFLNSLTSEKIANRAYIEKIEASSGVISGIEYETYEENELEGYVAYFDAEGNLVAIVCEETVSGYGGDITIVVGTKFWEGNAYATGVKVISQSETPGLGANVTSKSFLDQFVLKTLTIAVSKTTPKENEIKAITGATITSRSITEGVNDALERATELFTNGNLKPTAVYDDQE
ncbi:FMN-binding protein [Treponema sp. R6D11]